MEVTLNEWDMDSVIAHAKHPRLSLTAKGIILCMQCGAPRPPYNPEGSTQVDKAYRQMIDFGIARIK